MFAYCSLQNSLVYKICTQISRRSMKTNYFRDRNAEGLGWVVLTQYFSHNYSQMPTGAAIIQKFNWAGCPGWLSTWLAAEGTCWLTARLS